MLIAFLPQLACFSPRFSCKLLIEWFEHDQILFLKRMLGRQGVRFFSDGNNVLLIGTFRQIPLVAFLSAFSESCFLFVS